jgi:hypothetical protein
MSLPATAQTALQAFSACPGWEQRARLLMQWGDLLVPLSDAERSEANRVQGCESQVWLLAEQDGAHWQFRASCCWPESTACRHPNWRSWICRTGLPSLAWPVTCLPHAAMACRPY